MQAFRLTFVVKYGETVIAQKAVNIFCPHTYNALLTEVEKHRPRTKKEIEETKKKEKADKKKKQEAKGTNTRGQARIKYPQFFDIWQGSPPQKKKEGKRFSGPVAGK